MNGVETIIVPIVQLTALFTGVIMLLDIHALKRQIKDLQSRVS
jgi:hypothetical protein